MITKAYIRWPIKTCYLLDGESGIYKYTLFRWEGQVLERVISHQTHPISVVEACRTKTSPAFLARVPNHISANAKKVEIGPNSRFFQINAKINQLLNSKDKHRMESLLRNK